MREKGGDLDALGMISDAAVLRIGLRSAGITNQSPNDARKASERRLRSPEAP